MDDYQPHHVEAEPMAPEAEVVAKVRTEIRRQFADPRTTTGALTLTRPEAMRLWAILGEPVDDAEPDTDSDTEDEAFPIGPLQDWEAELLRGSPVDPWGSNE